MCNKSHNRIQKLEIFLSKVERVCVVLADSSWETSLGGNSINQRHRSRSATPTSIDSLATPLSTALATTSELFSPFPPFPPLANRFLIFLSDQPQQDYLWGAEQLLEKIKSPLVGVATPGHRPPPGPLSLSNSSHMSILVVIKATAAVEAEDEQLDNNGKYEWTDLNCNVSKVRERKRAKMANNKQGSIAVRTPDDYFTDAHSLRHSLTPSL